MDVHNLGDDEIALLFKTAVPIDDIDQLKTGPNDGFSIVWIDTQDRPDLQMLSSHTPSGDGFSICTWFYAGPGQRKMHIGLRVEMRQPQHFTLALDFKVERYIEQLQMIARTGKLWIVPGPIPSYLVGTQEMTLNEFMSKVMNVAGQGLFVELEEHLVEELREQLQAWQRGK